MEKLLKITLIDLGLYFYAMVHGAFIFYLLGIKGILIGYSVVLIFVLIWFLFYNYILNSKLTEKSNSKNKQN